MQILGNRRLRDDNPDLADCEKIFTLRCEELPLVPGVDHTSRNGAEELQRRRTELFCRDLDLVAAKHDIGPQDVLLVNSLRHWSLGDIVQWIESRGVSQAPTIVLILHYTPHPQPGVQDPAAKAYQEGFQRISCSPLSSKILLFTDSDRLRDEYQSLYDVPITVVPVPHCEGAIKLRADTNELSVVFAGEARRDKGFYLLPRAIREVLDNAPEPTVLFKIQAYREEGDAHESLQTILPADEAVRIFLEPLTEAEYASFIAEADLIMIPYLPGPYQTQTSGVYCEAAALGIPVVVPSGTWMADQVAKRGGGILFSPTDPASLGKACLKAIQSYPLLREEAILAASDWREFHNAVNFVACIEQRLRVG